MSDPLLSSKRDDWNTPPEIVALVSRVGRIALDPCSNPTSMVGATKAISLPEDGLAADWLWVTAARGLTFVNPPYGRQIAAWMGKCASEAARGTHIIALVPARVGTRWWAENVVRGGASQVCFLTGRVRFWADGKPMIAAGKNGKEREGVATFDAALVHWCGDRLGRENFAAVMGGAGWICTLQEGRGL